MMPAPRSYGACRKVVPNEKVAPIRSQYFYRDDGQYVDSQICHAVAASNLVGQALGRAVSPEDIALYGWPKPKAEDFAPIPYNHPIAEWMQDLSGYPEHDLERFIEDSACPQEAVDRFTGQLFQNACTAGTFHNEGVLLPCDAAQVSACPMGTLDPISLAVHLSLKKLGNDASLTGWQALYDESRVRKLSPPEMTQLLDKVCGSRLKFRGWRPVTEILSEDPARPHALLKTKSEMVADIDKLLDRGRYVAFGHDGHIVTIVGRTEECKYIINDSIPADRWLTPRKHYPVQPWTRNVQFQGQHYQFWDHDTLTSSIDEMTYLTEDGQK